MGSSVVSRDREGPQPREQQLSASLGGKENLRRVRDFIAALPPERLDMGYYLRTEDGDDARRVRFADHLSHCGTAACIAGWTVAVLTPDAEYDGGLVDGRDIDIVAGDLLGLDYQSAGELFFPLGWANRTHAEAVAALDHLLETGEIDWRAALSSEVPPSIPSEASTGNQATDEPILPKNPNQPGGEKL